MGGKARRAQAFWPRGGSAGDMLRNVRIAAQKRSAYGAALVPVAFAFYCGAVRSFP
jgi:hypothetical protein